MLHLLLLNHFLFTACLLQPPSSRAAASSPELPGWEPDCLDTLDGCSLGDDVDRTGHSVSCEPGSDVCAQPQLHLCATPALCPSLSVK
ncbi:unnamed protein product [Rangifer tarandus platyrhynchus]|uniref:Uncharacterized protein n=2 Tax=Rangifer tarandus platyrhynchus TaxID=3082113 RepID=A0ABN8ZUC3_RANTA|nr:unnamed protein product [Rangifer tarandus platyrhynchus]CAI9710293.1 unnamed protein product [Rangifer tarandus platyrhynchus]